MNVFLKIIKWLAITIGIVIIGFLVFLHQVDFSSSKEEIKEAFSSVSYEPEDLRITHNGTGMYAKAIGDKTKPIAFFVHGSPGSWDNFLDFMVHPRLLEHFQMISVDRPGFGNSANGHPERSLEKQAAALASILKSVRSNQPVYLVGHSFGGPVIARMAVDFPELASGLILVAPSIDPDLEKTKWYQIPAHWKVFSWMLPGMLYSTNEEILALKKELEELKPLWKKITVPVSVIQGGKDRLVPAANADFAKKMLVNAPVNMVFIDNMNHFVPWNRPGLIRQELFWLLEYSQQ